MIGETLWHQLIPFTEVFGERLQSQKTDKILFNEVFSPKVYVIVGFQHAAKNTGFKQNLNRNQIKIKKLHVVLAAN